MKTDPPSRRRGDVCDRRLSFPGDDGGGRADGDAGGLAVMLRLAELGWGSKRIAFELGYSRTTEKRYLRQGGWARYGHACASRRRPASSCRSTLARPSC